jgi:hypothetical protein
MKGSHLLKSFRCDGVVVAASGYWQIQSSGRSPLGAIFTKSYFTGGSGGSVPEDGGGELVDVPGFTGGMVSAPASSSGRMVMAMRRFLALPSAVALSARGRYSP